MNDIKIFESPAFGSVRTITRDGEPWFVAADVCRALPSKGTTPWHGYVYAVEYGDGIKIGHTTNLIQRITSIRRNAANYSDITVGAVAYTKAHTNHKENESVLHAHFSNFRRAGSERFNLSLESFLNDLPEIRFIDESEKKAARSGAFLSAMKNFVKRGELVE